MTLAFAILSEPLSSIGQQPKIFMIGVLTLVDPSTFEPYDAAFQQGLRELGYLEGQDIIIQRRCAGGESTDFPALPPSLSD